MTQNDVFESVDKLERQGNGRREIHIFFFHSTTNNENPLPDKIVMQKQIKNTFRTHKATAICHQFRDRNEKILYSKSAHRYKVEEVHGLGDLEEREERIKWWREMRREAWKKMNNDSNDNEERNDVFIYKTLRYPPQSAPPIAG
jgi:hypothetical protein